MKWDIKDIAISIFVGYVVITILNYLFHLAFPSIPVLQTGFAIILFLIGIVLTALFVFVRDGNFSKDEIYAMLVIIAIMIGVWWTTKHFLPELYNLIPNGTKEVFSFVG